MGKSYELLMPYLKWTGTKYKDKSYDLLMPYTHETLLEKLPIQVDNNKVPKKYFTNIHGIAEVKNSSLESNESSQNESNESSQNELNESSNENPSREIRLNKSN